MPFAAISPRRASSRRAYGSSFSAAKSGSPPATICLAGRRTAGLDRGGVAYDVDQPVDRVQAPEQIIVLAIGARQKRREMAEARALQAFGPAEFLQRLDVLRADAVDEDLVQFARVARGRHRKGEHVPERKAEVIHQHLAPCLRLPGG